MAEGRESEVAVGQSTHCYLPTRGGTHLEAVATEAEQQTAAHPERRDVFLCHAWEDRQGPAKELHDLLEHFDVRVWF